MVSIIEVAKVIHSSVAHLRWNLLLDDNFCTKQNIFNSR